MTPFEYYSMACLVVGWCVVPVGVASIVTAALQRADRWSQQRTLNKVGSAILRYEFSICEQKGWTLANLKAAIALAERAMSAEVNLDSLRCARRKARA